MLGGLLAIPFSGNDAGRTITSGTSAATTANRAPAVTSYTVTSNPVTSNPVTSNPVTSNPATSAMPPTAVTSNTVTSPTAVTSSSATPATVTPATAAPASTTPATNPPATAPAGADPAPPVGARAYVVVDADTGATLAASDADAELPVASIFKLLTAYVVMQAGDPAKVVTVPALQLVDGESQIYLRPGEQFPRDLLLRAMLIVSAGDAAETLAVDVAGSNDAFVDQMNAAARSLGLSHTVAANPEGLDAPGAYSSAADVAVLARTLMGDATFRATVARRSASLHGVTFPATNTLLGSYPGTTGVKTGHTTAAGYCLAASATRDGRSLIVVVLGTDSIPARDINAAALLNWGFDHLADTTAVAA